MERGNSKLPRSGTSGHDKSLINISLKPFTLTRASQYYHHPPLKLGCGCRSNTSLSHTSFANCCIKTWVRPSSSILPHSTLSLPALVQMITSSQRKLNESDEGREK